MNLLVLQVSIPKVKDNILTENKTVINYTVILDEARINDYNHSIYLPTRTVILEDVKELLKYDINVNEFNISFTQVRLLREFQELKFRNKTINTGLLGKHEITEELLDTTPVFLDRDSIKQSLELLEINKAINSFESVLAQSMTLDYLKAKKDIERIKPIKSSLNYAYLHDGFAFSGPAVNEVKKNFRIKNMPSKARYYFSTDGEPFYTLGNLGRLSNELNEIWNKK